MAIGGVRWAKRSARSRPNKPRAWTSLVAVVAVGVVSLWPSSADAASGTRYGSGNGCYIKVYGTDGASSAWSYTQDRYASCWELRSRTQYVSGGVLMWGTTTQSTGEIVYSFGAPDKGWANSVGSSSTIGYAWPCYVYGSCYNL
jgi:hypothetical protein